MQQLTFALLDVVPATCVFLLLHFFRHAIGHHSLHILMGVFLLLGVLSGLPNFIQAFEAPTLSAPLSYGALSIPVFSILLLIYEIHGTVETQRIILGLSLTLLAIGTFSMICLNYYSDTVFTMFHAKMNLARFIGNLRQGLFIFTVTQLILFLSIPILFQALRNFRCPFGISLLVCNCLVYFCSELNIMYLYPNFITRDAYILWGMKFIAACVVSAIIACYLRISTPITFERKRTFGIITSIFRHLQTNDTLRKSMAEWAEKYQNVLNHSMDLIFIVDPKGYVVNANLAVYRVLGNNLDNRLNIHDFLKDSQGVPFSIPQAWFQEILADTSDAKPASYYHMLLTPPGSEKQMEIDFNLSHASVDGEPLALLIARDMTEQRNQERQKAQLQEQLFHSQRLESLGVLAGGVAHDFNNLLHSIQGSADVLRQQHLDSTSLNMVSNIDEATKRAAKLTNQLLGFARKGNYNLETIELEHLLLQVSQLFKTTCHDITFKTLIEPGQMTIRADSTQLQQVILNLLLNARDAIDQDVANPKIVLRGERVRENTPEWQHRPDKEKHDAQNYVCIKVKDNGCGMSQEVMKHIFEPFYTTKGIGKGTGMGLAMAYGCIENLHGWIHVDSKPNQGTEFTVVLPITNAS
ncbi:MAG: hypothetical protein J6X55_02720 [Victivallales bacterium]|nr:hypothetical protein [Victivallales bacterium]